MFKYFHYVACALLLPVIAAEAEEVRDNSAPKIVSGMSIVGNYETPKSLYIVPWKNVEVNTDVNVASSIVFTSSILKEELSPVDKGDIIRALDYYKNSNSN